MTTQKPKVQKPTTFQNVLDVTTKLESLTNEEFSQLVELLKTKKPVSNYKKGINIGVGDFIKALIKDGKPNNEILKEVHEHFDNKNTTYACVAWYRNDMKKKGLI